MTENGKSRPIAVGDHDFDQVVEHAEGPVLVDFWAPWCGPCRAVGSILEELAGEYGGRLTVAKVNVDEHNEKAAAFGVRAIPTLVLFDQGRAVQTFVGVQPKAVLKAAIDPLAA